MTAHEPMMHSVFAPTADGTCPIGLHLELLCNEIADTVAEVRAAVAGRPQGTTTFLTTMADGLEQSAARLHAVWRELYPGMPVTPWIVGSIPNEGKTFPARPGPGLVSTHPGAPLVPVTGFSIELEGELTPRGVQAIEQMVARAADPEPEPLPDAEGLAAARLAPRGQIGGIGPDLRTPEQVAASDAVDPPGDRVVDLMAALEASVAAAKAARKARLRRGTKVRVVAEQPIIGGLDGVVVESGPNVHGVVRVRFEAITATIGVRREVLEVPLQAGDRVAHRDDSDEVWRVAEVLEDGRLILGYGLDRSGPLLPEGWERVE
jgi:hypothetical protein